MNGINKIIYSLIFLGVIFGINMADAAAAVLMTDSDKSMEDDGDGSSTYCC